MTNPFDPTQISPWGSPPADWPWLLAIALIGLLIAMATHRHEQKPAARKPGRPNPANPKGGTNQ